MNILSLFNKKRIYLDYAAATPVRPHIVKLMLPYFTETFANAGSIHIEGVAVKRFINEARARLAAILHIRPQGIVFTGSGTESNNIAIFGIVEKRHKAGVAYADMEIISTAIEHPSVTEVLRELASRGVVIKEAPLTPDGLIDTHIFASLLSQKTVLVCFAYVNSEIGTIQPTHKIARTVRAYEKEQGTKIHIHVDAAQAPLWLPCALDQVGADSLSLDAGKCYGPKGVGVLAFAYGVTLLPVIYGGGQEFGLRSATENTALIVGCVEALCVAQEGFQARSSHVAVLRDELIELCMKIPTCVLNGSREHRVANNVNISLPGIDSEFAVITLDEKGIACSTKSACGSGKGDGSSVVRAVYGDDDRARSTIRFTLGEATTPQELEKTIAVLKTHVTKMRRAQIQFSKV